MENGFIWKINGTLITAEAPADVDLSVAKATDYIPASLYKLISTNQNDFAFHLGASGAFNFPMVLSVKADASCAGLMANLFWYDAQSQVLQCIQSVTVSGALERSIPYADFTLSKGQDYFVVFATESFNLYPPADVVTRMSHNLERCPSQRFIEIEDFSFFKIHWPLP